MSRILYLLSPMLLAGPSLAQTTAEPPEIIVEGTKEYDRQIDRFVEALTDAPIGGQLSRFDWTACPAAVGLPDEQNQAVTDRMRQVAGAAGIKLAAARCKPNALAIVADDKQEFIEALWNKYPDYFANPQGRRVKPSRDSSPATAWHVEGIVDANGFVPGQDLFWKYYYTNSVDTSRLQPAAHPHFVAGVVVIERKALAGLTTKQLADYAAMRIFARTDPARLHDQAPTILSILDAPMGSAVPITLTEWDLGFLRALYASGGRQYAGRQRDEIQSRMRDELERSQANRQK